MRVVVFFVVVTRKHCSPASHSKQQLLIDLLPRVVADILTLGARGGGYGRLDITTSDAVPRCWIFEACQSYFIWMVITCVPVYEQYVACRSCHVLGMVS